MKTKGYMWVILAVAILPLLCAFVIFPALRLVGIDGSVIDLSFKDAKHFGDTLELNVDYNAYGRYHMSHRYTLEKSSSGVLKKIERRSAA